MIDERRTGLALAASKLARAPALVIRVPLEGAPAIGLLAKTTEDERRLLGWLRRSRVVNAIPETVEAALDRLEAE